MQNHSPNNAGFNNILPWLIPLDFAVSGGERGFCGWIGWFWEEGRHSDEWREHKTYKVTYFLIKTELGILSIHLQELNMFQLLL